MGKNLFTSSAEYYDLFEPKKDITKAVIFISKILKKFNVNSLLELGCGTGSYTILLKGSGFDVEGLDFSKNMLNEARKKDKKIKFYQKDMSNFKINKKYDSIVCIGSSLLALANFMLIEKVLRNSYDHLNSNGIMLLDLPNHVKEIKECDNSTQHATYKILGGELYSTSLCYKKGDRWIEEWYGKVKKDNKVSKFKDVWEEFIYSPKKLEASLKRIGFKILKIYGSMGGNKFDINKSYRRVYLCRKF